MNANLALPQEIITSAKREIGLGNADSAIALLMAGVARFPANPLLSAHLGMAYLCAGSRVNTLRAFKEAQTKSQTLPEWIERGITAIEQGFVNLNGVKLAVPPEVVSEKVLRYLIEGGYEGRERTLLRNNVTAEDRVLELGAGLGYLACVIGCEQPLVKYIAIEANPRLIPIIEQNFQANNCKAMLMHGVAAAQTGISNFNMADDFWASSACELEQRHESVEIPTIDVNAVIHDFHPTVMVIDIEGGESDLVPQLDLAKVERIVIELHPDVYGHQGATAVVRSLMDAGFLLDTKQSGSQVFLFVCG